MPCLHPLKESGLRQSRGGSPAFNFSYGSYGFVVSLSTSAGLLSPPELSVMANQPPWEWDSGRDPLLVVTYTAEVRSGIPFRFSTSIGFTNGKTIDAIGRLEEMEREKTL